MAALKLARRIIGSLVVPVALLAVAGCVVFAIAWKGAKDQENRDFECALRAPRGATYEARKADDATLCIYRNEQGTEVRRVRVPNR